MAEESVQDNYNHGRLHLVAISPMMTTQQSNGHFFWLYKALREKSKDFEIDSSCVASRQEKSVEVIPILDVGNSAHGTYCALTFKSFRQFVHYFSTNNRERIKVFHFYDGGFADLIFIAVLMNKFPKDLFVLNLHWANEVSLFLNSDDKFEILQLWIIKFLLRGINQQLLITAESESLAILCERKLNRTVCEYPVMSLYDFSPSRIKNVDFTIVIQEKVHLEEVMAALDLLPRGKQFKVVVIVNVETGISAQYLESIRPNVSWEVISHTLTPHEYANLYGKSKSIVLPYSSNFYKFGSSGRLLDAYNFGCAVVVPDGLAIALKARELGIGQIYSRGNAASLAKALSDSLSIDFDVFSSQCAPTLENAFKRLKSFISVNDKQEFTPNNFYKIWIWTLIFQIIVRLQWMARTLNDFVLKVGYRFKRTLFRL